MRETLQVRRKQRCHHCTVSSSKEGVPIEESAIITLIGAGRCSFEKNGVCKTHQVMSTSVKVTSREWNGYWWTYKKVTNLVCRVRNAGSIAPDISMDEQSGAGNKVKVHFRGLASHGD